MSNFPVMVVWKALGVLVGIWFLSYIIRVAAGVYLYLASSSEGRSGLERHVRRVFPTIDKAVNDDRATMSRAALEETDSRIREGYQRKKWWLWSGLIGALMVGFAIMLGIFRSGQ